MSSQNLSISEFLKKYGKPYDENNDDYDIPPFQKNIDNASKSSKIYNMHMYWTKQDPYVVKQYIEHYTYYDPPYGANINYSELNLVFESWLSYRTDIKEEIIENEYQDKDRLVYEMMMYQAVKNV